MTGARDRQRIVCVSSARAAHHPRHHYRLAAALAGGGFDAITLAQHDLTPGHADAVPVRYLPERRNRLTRMASAPLSIARALRMSPDALYVMSLDLLPWAVLARVLARRPVVYDSNDEYDTFMLIKEWLPRPVRPVLQRVVRVVEPWLAARLDAATTALPATQEKFERAGVRSHLIRNFPPLSILGEDVAGDRSRYDVLLGGSLPEEQVPILAWTAAAVRARGRRLSWIVAARNYGPQDRALLERELDAAGVRDDFELRYNVPFVEMKQLMASSRVGFVLYPSGPNYAARIPIRIFEYMAAGLPFVASDLPTTAEFTGEDDVAVLVAAGDHEAFARALLELIDDEPQWRAMSARGPQLVRNRFNWERESERLVALFRGLLERPA